MHQALKYTFYEEFIWFPRNQPENIDGMKLYLRFSLQYQGRKVLCYHSISSSASPGHDNKHYCSNKLSKCKTNVCIQPGVAGSSR